MPSLRAAHFKSLALRSSFRTRIELAKTNAANVHVGLLQHVVLLSGTRVATGICKAKIIGPPPPRDIYMYSCPRIALASVGSPVGSVVPDSILVVSSSGQQHELC